jgi:hypothetical protein
MKTHERAIRSLTGHAPHKRKEFVSTFLLLIFLSLTTSLFPSSSLALSLTLSLEPRVYFQTLDNETAKDIKLQSNPEPVPVSWDSILSPSFQGWRQSASGDRERQTKFMRWIHHAFRQGHQHQGHQGHQGHQRHPREIWRFKRNQPCVITPEPGSGLLIATGLTLLFIRRSFSSRSFCSSA